MSDAQELLPCPFCGHTPTFEEAFAGYNQDKWWGIHCGSCGAVGPENRTGYTKDTNALFGELAQQWNARQPAAQSEGAQPAEQSTDKDAPTQPSGWLGECRQMAAQCWCDEETKHIPMYPALAEAFAHRLAAWMDTGAQHARNEEYWRDEAEAAEQRVAALEAQIKAAQEQEPVAWMSEDGKYCYPAENVRDAKNNGSAAAVAVAESLTVPLYKRASPTAPEGMVPTGYPNLSSVPLPIIPFPLKPENLSPLFEWARQYGYECYRFGIAAAGVQEGKK